MKVYVVVDVGCIECGEPTSVKGVFLKPPDITLGEYFAGGQHSVELFEVEVTE